jgi:ligand-binding sensor domain-containing protein
MTEDPDGTFWLGTNGGLNRIDPAALTTTLTG